MIIAVTGHRPEDCRSEQDVRRRFRNTFEEVFPATVICGMAAGVDLWAGDEARLLGVEIWAARPWAGHVSRKGDEELYQRIVEEAGRVINVDEGLNYPGPWIYQERNMWMVDHATNVAAYWSGKRRGGTFNCIEYAKEVKVPVRNIY